MTEDDGKTILDRLKAIADQVTNLGQQVAKVAGQVETLEEHLAQTERRHDDRTGEVIALARAAIDLFKPVKSVVDELGTIVAELEGRVAKLEGKVA